MHKQYKVSNWSEYNKSLVNRGRIDLWLDFDLLAKEKVAYGGFGRPKQYGEYLMIVLSALRSMFNLPLRFLQGLARTLLKLEAIPDYTTICKRLKDIKIALPKMRAGSVLAIDATGLKILGDGEWLRYKYGQQRPRKWEKLTIAVDIATGQIVAHHNMPGNNHDVNAIESIANTLRSSNTKAALILADGAYDNKRSYDFLTSISSKILVPPRTGARFWPGYEDRKQAIEYIASKGRYLWAKHSGYTFRNHVEAAFARMKKIFTSALRSRTTHNKSAEITSKIALNAFSSLGRAKLNLVT